MRDLFAFLSKFWEIVMYQIGQKIAGFGILVKRGAGMRDQDPVKRVGEAFTSTQMDG